MQHQFFQGFVPQQNQNQVPGNTTPELQHNVMVLEIYANWSFVLKLFRQITNKKINQVSNLEKDWINFVNSNKLVLKSYKNKEDFMEQNLKPLTKDENVKLENKN